MTFIYYRTQCTFRKAKIEDKFEPLKQAYESRSEFKATGGPIRRGKASLVRGGVINGKAVSLPKPSYPREARADNASGAVNVDVLIDEKGEIVSACAAPDAHPALGEASEIAAYKAKFSPTTLEGSPVKVFGRIVYSFSR